MHSHLKMEGWWDVYPAGARWRHPAWQARAVLGVPGVVTVGFLLGELEVVPREREHELVEHLGPDILGPGWDAAVAARNLGADADRPIGLALLDQRAVAGLGNVYRNELCFLRGVLPTRPVGEVSDLEGLAELAHRLIFANRDRLERSTTGDLRRGERHRVHGRAHRPCRRCGPPIVRGALGETDPTGSAGSAGRQTFFCPACQR